MTQRKKSQKTKSPKIPTFMPCKKRNVPILLREGGDTSAE